MEQQHSQEKVHPAETVRKPERQALRTPERERLSAAGHLMQAVAEGQSLLELPPLRLEELAALVGNQEMAALLEQQSLPLEETRFSLPEAPETAPFPVPDTGPVPTVQPPALTDGAWSGRAFDPAGLSY